MITTVVGAAEGIACQTPSALRMRRDVSQLKIVTLVHITNHNHYYNQNIFKRSECFDSGCFPTLSVQCFHVIVVKIEKLQGLECNRLAARPSCVDIDECSGLSLLLNFASHDPQQEILLVLEFL